MEEGNEFERHFAVTSSARLMTAATSNKRVWHMEMTCEESFDYSPGDAFAIHVRNSDEDVEDVLKLCKADGDRVLCLYEGEKMVAGPMKVRRGICTDRFFEMKGKLDCFYVHLL